MAEKPNRDYLERAGIKWLLDRRNALILEKALIKQGFEIVPPIQEYSKPRLGNNNFKDVYGNFVSVQYSQIKGYKAIIWTKGCDSLIADVFGGFSAFSRAKSEDY